ncbi:MAG: phosphatase PAP2 family protein, partial [Bacillota bacterium]
QKSFPSGHATGSFATATVLANHYPELGKFAYTWASLVAISRMYEDAHWFSDVVVGSAIGYFTARQTLGLRLTWSW